MLNNTRIPVVKSSKYLGVMFSNDLNFNNFICNKFNEVHKTYNSLYNYGTRPNGLNPFTKAHIYKTFCLPKALYGLSIITLTDSMLRKLDRIQNMILRNTLSLSKYNHLSSIKSVLQIENIDIMYLKSKCSLFNILKRHPVSRALLQSCSVSEIKANKKNSTYDFDRIASKAGCSRTNVFENPMEAWRVIKASLPQPIDLETDRIGHYLLDFNKINMHKLRQETFIFNCNIHD